MRRKRRGLVAPDGIGTLVDWGDPGRESYAEGAVVATARNLVTESAGYTAAGSARPTFRSAGINGRAAFDFDGSANVLAGTASLRAMFNGVAGISLLAVLQRASATPGATQDIYHVGTNTVPANPRASMRSSVANTNTVSSRRLDADAQATTSGVALTATPTIVLLAVDFVLGTQRLWVNGGVSATAEGSLASSGGVCSATNAGLVSLGGSVSIFYAGKMGARAAWTTVVTPTSAATLNAGTLDLVRRWGGYYGITTA